MVANINKQIQSKIKCRVLSAGEIKSIYKNKYSVTTPSSIGFRFGDGGRINSFETATIPAEIAGVKCQIILTEVIKKDIPLITTSLRVIC